MSRIERVEKRLDKFLDNEWVHMNRRVGWIQGVTWVTLAIGGLILSLVVTVLVRTF